ncbi:MAG: bile acid:sodium symporter family protein, partial [Methanosarcinales archaeon]
MHIIVQLLKNSNIVFLSALFLGLIYPMPSAYLEDWIVFTLIVVMIFSLTEVKFTNKISIKEIIISFFMNYIFLSGLIIALAYFLISDEQLYYGFVVMAAVPPAVAIIPFTKLLNGDLKLSLITNASLYVISIGLTPAILLLFAKTSDIDYSLAIITLLELMVLPMIISRFILQYNKYYLKIKKDINLVINIGFFIVIYTVIALNRNKLFTDLDILLIPAIIGFLRTFVSGMFLYKLGNILKINPKKNISYTLFGSYKNLGLSATLALLLFSAKASIPSAVCIVMEIGFFIFLSTYL